jgi:hypothetical protein
VTNSSGCVVTKANAVTSTCSPFAPTAYAIPDPSGKKEAYATVLLAYTWRLDVTFEAIDPNPEDHVTMLMIEDPGLPEGMTVQRVECASR